MEIDHWKLKLKKVFTVRHYSQALFSLAFEEKKIDRFLSDLELVYDIIKRSKDFKRLLSNPEILFKEKEKIIKNIFKNRLLPEIYNFAFLLIKKDNLNLLGEIFYNFKKRALEEKNVLEVGVISAVDLKKPQEKKIAKILKEKTKKEIKIKKSLNPKIIGGVIIKIGDEVLDLSLKKRLEVLRQSLT